MGLLSGGSRVVEIGKSRTAMARAIDRDLGEPAVTCFAPDGD